MDKTLIEIIFITVAAAVCAILMISRKSKSGAGKDKPDADEAMLEREESVRMAVEAIDLGLSVRWASCNLLAMSAEDRGGLYGWADSLGIEKTAKTRNDAGVWTSSLYGGAAPPRDICGTRLDIARAKLSPLWHLPSEANWQELIDKCQCEMVEMNGIKGIRATGPNGNSIFLPSAGGRLGFASPAGVGENGCYWSGTLDVGDSDCAYCLMFDSSGIRVGSAARFCGFSIRAVAD
jgi:hypothetical protein